MVQIIEARGLGGSGGGGFVLGNEPNTFADNAARDTQAASDSAWLASYDANKTLVVRVGSGSSFTYFRRPITPTGTDDWEDVTTIITGPPGMGAIPQNIADGTLLRAFDNAGTIEVRASSFVESDAGIAASKMIMARPSGLQLGEQGGTQIAAATDDITYRTPTDEDHIVVSQIFDRTTGASRPQRLAFGAASVFPAADGVGTTFTGKQTISYTSVARAFTRAIRFRPLSAGTLNLKVYLGSEATGKILADVDVTVSQADVGTLVDTDDRVFTPGDSPSGQLYTFVLEGVDLDGGVSSGASANPGENLPFMDVIFHAATDVDILDRNDISQAEEDRLTAFTDLGNPASVGQFLSSTTDGTLSWQSSPTGIDRFFDKVEERRLDTDLVFSGTVDPGSLAVFDINNTDNLTVTLPASTSDSQILSRWGVNNNKVSGVLTLQGDGTAGHTFILQGASLPFRLENGRFYEIVLVGRSTNQSTYRVVELDAFAGTPIRNTSVGGTSITQTPPSAIHSRLDFSGTGGADYDVTLSGVGGILPFTGHYVTLRNVDTSNAARLQIANNGTFAGTGSQRLVLLPGATLPLMWGNNNGTPEIVPIAPIEYEFIMTTTDILGNGATSVNWENIPSMLDHLVYSPASGQTDANALITRPGVSCQVYFTLEWLGGWGAATGAFADGTTVTVQPRVENVNDSMGPSITYTQFHRSGAPVSHSREWSGFMTGGQRLTLTTTNLETTGPRMIEVQARVRLRFTTI